MPPENLRFGGGAAETVLHPIVLVAMLLTIVLIFFLPRRYVLLPVLSMFFLVPLGQEVFIGGLHFFVARLIILAVWVRMIFAIFSTPEGILGGHTDILDKVFLLWAFFRAAAGILTFMQVGAVIYQLGFLLDAVGGYFVLRYLIYDEAAVLRTIRILAVLSFVIGLCMLYEKFTVVNVFGFLGGVREAPEIREGVVRAVGPFQHELLGGVFGATLLPLFFLLWKEGTSRLLAIIGFIGSTFMTVASASSTPLLAYVAAVFAICCWPFRRKMRLLRWGTVACLLALSVVMKAPVWFVIQHLNILGGSSGYHRAMLINDFIMHFSDWWLIGTKANHTWGFSMWDLLNQFVAEGEVGGLATFLCFIGIIYLCFSKVGKARKAVEGDRKKEWFFWLFGCALVSHVVAYFGVSYFDQTRFLWLALLAMIITATAPYLAPKTVAEHASSNWYRQPRLAYKPVTFAGMKNRMLAGRHSQFKSQSQPS